MIYIINGQIITMNKENYNCGTIVVDNGKIVQIGKNISISPKEEDIVIDATNLWVMPGLIDAHCHIGITEEKKRD